jgi:hypothetical protein
MKNLFFTLMLLVAFGTTVNAQYDYWPYLEKATARADYIKWKQKYRDSITQNHITQAITVKKIFDKKGNISRSVTKSELQFDAKGDIISVIEYDRKGRLKYKLLLTYYDNGIPRTSKKYNAQGNFVRGWEITLDDEGQMVKRTSYWKKEDKIAWGEEFTYNQAGNVIKSHNFDDEGKTYVTVEYDYYNDNSPKETRTYNKKGKLKTVLKYDCQPTGTLANGKKTDTSTVCTKSVYDADSNRIDTRETIKQDGKVWRSRQAYQYKYAYSPNGKISEFYYSGYRKMKNGYRDVYTYNDKGEKLSITRYDYKNRLKHETCELIR